MSFELPALPYAMDALEPYISAKTMEFHYGKHHKAYVDNLNNLIKDTLYASMDLDDIIRSTVGKPEAAGIFNNAAQAWNHAFFWNSMRKNGSGWAWLIEDNDMLRVVKTSNADTPVAHGFTPILTIDVWEHAYYLDYQNQRAAFVDAYLNHLINW